MRMDLGVENSTHGEAGVHERKEGQTANKTSSQMTGGAWEERTLGSTVALAESLHCVDADKHECNHDDRHAFEQRSGDRHGRRLPELDLREFAGCRRGDGQFLLPA